MDRTLLQPSEEQIASCERLNPRFRERDTSWSKRFGDHLVQATIRLGVFQGLGLVYAQVVIDKATLNTWILVHLPDDPDAHLRLLRDVVMPELCKRSAWVKAISTPSNARYGRLERGGEYHDYIEWHLKAFHDLADPPCRRTNGLVVAFKQEFMPVVKVLARRRKWCLGQIQAAVDWWLVEE